MARAMGGGRLVRRRGRRLERVRGRTRRAGGSWVTYTGCGACPIRSSASCRSSSLSMQPPTHPPKRRRASPGLLPAGAARLPEPVAARCCLHRDTAAGGCLTLCARRTSCKPRSPAAYLTEPWARHGGIGRWATLTTTPSFSFWRGAARRRYATPSTGGSRRTTSRLSPSSYIVNFLTSSIGASCVRARVCFPGVTGRWGERGGRGRSCRPCASDARARGC